MTSFLLNRIAAASTRRVSSSVSRRELAMLVPLDDELPGLPSLSPTAAKATAGSVTTLANGLTIVSEDSCMTSTVTLTFPKAGSGSEMVDEHGAAFINKCMNFKSGSGMSTLLINRTIEDEGGFPFSSVDRSGATLGYTVTPEKAAGLMSLLATECSFEKWDLRDAKNKAVYEAQVAKQSAQLVLTECLFSAAYGAQSPGGRPLYHTDVSRDTLIDFRDKAYGLNGAVLSATGIKDHSAFVTEASIIFESSPVGSDIAPAKMVYLGGESRVAASTGGFAHVALGFKAPSSSIMTSVVKQFFNVAGLEMGLTTFSSTGVVGVYAGSTSTTGLCESMMHAIRTTPTPELMKRAKNLAKAEALFALDGGSFALANVMTAFTLETGNFSGPADIVKAYDSLTDAQVKDAIAITLKSNPSLAAVGNISMIPYHATVVSSLA